MKKTLTMTLMKHWWWWIVYVLLPSVAYLLVYHIIFIMFVWTYWQTIFTRPMNPLKEVSVPDCAAALLPAGMMRHGWRRRCRLGLTVWLNVAFGLVMTPVWKSPQWLWFTALLLCRQKCTRLPFACRCEPGRCSNYWHGAYMGCDCNIIIRVKFQVCCGVS